jgi:1,4-dihydroxy-2-naphthoate octaprenyltransferase
MNIKQIVLGMRLPFLTGSVLPVLAAAAWVRHTGHAIFPDVVPVVFAVAFLHLGANLLNDYYDTPGTDTINRYRTPFSGGSRVILDGVMSARGVMILSLSLFAAAGLIGVYFFAKGRVLVPAFGLAGAVIGTVYSARWPNLMGRGLGELCIFVAFGPLLSLGAGYAMTGTLDPMQLVVGALPGFLITAVLWINEFPDFEADSASGKRNLVVRMGKNRAKFLYPALMFAPYVVCGALAVAGLFPWLAALMVVALPLVVKAVGIFWRNWDDPRAIVPAQALTIQSHLAVSALLTVGLFFRGN